MSETLPNLTALDAVSEMRAGRLSSEALVTACLERIAQTDAQIRAWAHVDPDLALEQAREADRIRKSGRATGALHGVPVGLKDIVDTRDMPTELGTPICAGRRPETDAAIVNRLREAGAVILGKTKTTEFAFAHPTDTANPHDAARTPGGSSSGSAAAVAAGHVPIAMGTQTNGSVIRPASFCGVYGFKPTRGVISRTGILRTSVTLDQVGTFGRSLEDVAVLANVLGGFDPDDPESFARPRPDMLGGARSEPPVEPVFAWFDLPHHDRLDSDAAEGLESVIDALGGQVERFGAAPQLAALVDVHAKIHEYEFCQHLAEIIDEHRARLSPTLEPIVARGLAISRAEYEDALAVKQSAETFFSGHFNDFDAILAPAATGEAPALASGGTGDPVFCTIWTLAGLPAVTLPILVGETGLPIGVQLVGGPEEDDRLLRTASWFQTELARQSEGGAL
ncbi:amidase [Nitratireductor sp. XY-223]|uniref:amidase n=1 Tax=Nitratireductor sp. XY-223 TaxID=2561926 RepID=UPI0010AA84D0|nr:amidase [Nitratireductor sp. XY-223]